MTTPKHKAVAPTASLGAGSYDYEALKKATDHVARAPHRDDAAARLAMAAAVGASAHKPKQAEKAAEVAKPEPKAETKAAETAQKGA